MVEAELGGLLPRDFEGAAPLMDLSDGSAPEYSHRHKVEVHDARRLQTYASTDAGFFDKHAFVLLPHATAVRDWDRDVESIYRAEIDTIIRERLLPGRRVHTIHAPRVMRRGAGRRYYARYVHADAPLTVDLYARNVGAFGSAQTERLWRQAFARRDVERFVWIDFWRTTNMTAPLRHMPLAMCEPNSVARADIFPTILRLRPEGRAIHHLALRFNPAQAWHYYPEIAPSEVIAFKHCEFRKDDPEAAPQNVFHVAFIDPSAPADAEERQSCDHRVGVMVLRD
jgi:hypothetical protein